MSRWADARAELFGDPYQVWHDGPDFAGLRDRWRLDPDGLLDLLFEGMTEGDALASESLSELDPAPTGTAADRVIATLTEHLPAARPGAAVQIARTLFRLTGSTQGSTTIAAVLDSAVHWGDRIDAAIALRGFPPSEPLRAALLRNVQAEDYLVRYHSATTLLRWAGDTSEISDDAEIFPQLVEDSNAESWAMAAKALAAR